ncbi:hypothetical protein ES703_90091 [subsurface metagenome]
MKKGMDLTIKGHKAWVDYITGKPALEPWHKEPRLTVWICIDGSHPVSGFEISLPLKEYTRDELKKLIEKEGPRQFEEIIARHDAERKKQDDYANRKQQVEEVARKVAEAAGVELLEDKR